VHAPTCAASLVRQTMSLLASVVMLAACADGRRERPRSSPASPTTPDAAATPVLEDAGGNRDAIAAGDLADAYVVPTWIEPSAESIYAMLQHDAGGEPAALVETPAGLVAVTPTGVVLHQLVKAKKLANASYDARFSIIWFMRGGALVALDLRDTHWEPIVVLEQMPPLPSYLFPGTNQLPEDPCGRPCVELTTNPPGFEVHAERSDVVPGTPTELRRIQAISKYKPVLTESGATFLSKLKNPAQRPRISPLELSADIIAPNVSGSKGPMRNGCNGTCGRGFALSAFGWSVVSTGRTCRCDDDVCTPRCSLYDPVTARFAPISRNAPWTAKLRRSELLCDIELDASQIAYRLPDGSGVCTKDGCRKVGGRVFAWLTPGPIVPSQQLGESFSDGCGS